MVRRLLYLNGLAIVCVILFHTAGWGLTAMFAWTPRYLPVSEPVFDQTGSAPYYWIRLIEQIIAVAIPAFLFVSGYFVAFATGSRSHLEWRQIAGRIKALVIPYTIWSLMIWCSSFVVLGEVASPTRYLIQFLIGSTEITFYFVPLLVQYYALSPLAIPLARHRWRTLLLVTGIFHVVLQAGVMIHLLYGDESVLQWASWSARMPKWLFLSRLFWFVLGMVVGFHISQFKQFLERFRWLFAMVAIMCVPLGMFEWEAMFYLSGQNYLNMRETIVDSIYALSFICAVLAFTNRSLPWNKQVSALGVRSFGIYLTHYTAMVYVAKAIYRFTPWMLGVQVMFQPIILCAGLAAPLALMYVVERTSLRRYYGHLFG